MTCSICLKFPGHEWFLSMVRAIGACYAALYVISNSAEGINPNRDMKCSICVMASGMLAAIGGAYLSIGDINMFSKNMVSGRGYTALSMVILGNRKPLWVALGGLVYGFARSLQFGLQGVNVPPHLVQMLPYILTLTFLFYPELKEAAYKISRIMGESIKSDQIRGRTLPDIMENNQPIAQRGGYAFKEAVEADDL